MKIIMSFLLCFCLASCTPETSQPESPTQTARPIQLYSSPTPTEQKLTPTPEVQATDIPLPTPTPVIYKVVANDTLIGIALRFGLELDDILAANPSINPNILSIGTELIIPQPTTEEGAIAEPLITPEELHSLSEVSCFPSSENGLMCFWMLQNENDFALGDISAQISLINKDGSVMASQVALMPFNLLGAGESLPVASFFPSILNTFASVQARVLTAYQAPEPEQRSIPSTFSELSIQIEADGLSARATGKYGLSNPGQSASQTWVLAVAFDDEGRVVGIRRWESSGAISSGELKDFSVAVYSMGPLIHQVQVYIDSMP